MQSRLGLVFAALFLCSCAVQEENSIALELRYQSDVMPQSCSEQRGTAEKMFRQKWVAYLIEPAKTTVVQSDAERAKTGSAKLAPVGSHQIVLNEWTLTNRMASLFINCEKREGYVLARGGYTDQRNWYGPFKF